MSLFSKNALGIDISDSSIEMLELKEKGRALRVVAYRRLELPDGIVNNGRIVNQQLLISKLIETLSLPGYGNFSTKAAVVSLPESQTYIHLFRLPAVISSQQLGEAIQYEAEETLPLFWDQTAHDYQVVRKDKDNQDVLYVAGSNEIVHSYQRVVSGAGFELEALEAESASLARALVGNQASEPVLIADIGARTTILTIYDQQAVHFSENIQIGGRHISDALAQTLSVPLAEAEALKKKSGLNSLPSAQAIEPWLLKIVEAARKVMLNYKKNSGRQVSQIIMCGGSSLLPGVVEHISKQLHVQAILGNPLSNMAPGDKVFNSQPPILFSTVIGLAKRGLDHVKLQVGINLLRHAKGKDAQSAKGGTKATQPKQAAATLGSNWIARNKRGLVMIGVFMVLVIAFGILYVVKMRPFG
ncbi:MAG: type IV pilus assembly protein PilM [Patescibacteria group bacterium]